MISVYGIKESVAKFAAMAAKTEVTAEAAARAGAEPVEAAMKETVAVLTGKLRDSIHIESRLDGTTGQADVIAGGGEVDYAVFVEFTPVEEPFMRPAADSAHDEAEHAVTIVVNGALL